MDSQTLHIRTAAFLVVGLALLGLQRQQQPADRLAETAPPALRRPNHASSAATNSRSQQISRPQPQIAPTNLQTATEQQLQQLPGIGPTLARRIMEHRKLHVLRDINDLASVRGIGATKLQRIREFLQFTQHEQNKTQLRSKR